MDTAVQIVRRLFTASEYEKMVSAGILTKYDKVELLNGEILDKAPVSSVHAACRSRLNHLLAPRIGSSAIIHLSGSIRLDNRSMPEPDMALLEPCDDFYAEDYPCPDDILLLVEIADTSLEFDRNIKLPLYAQAGIPEVWLVDLNDERIEVHREPEPGGYREMRAYWPGDMLETFVHILSPVPVVDILGAQLLE